jgi:micrococcal nuclease
MIGLDAPEFSKSRFGYAECFGLEAKNHLIDLLANKKEITLEQDKTQGDLDMYGRTLAYIIADGININLQMIHDGYGFEETFKKSYKYQKEHKDAQASADK